MTGMDGPGGPSPALPAPDCGGRTEGEAGKGAGGGPSEEGRLPLWKAAGRRSGPLSREGPVHHGPEEPVPGDRREGCGEGRRLGCWGPPSAVTTVEARAAFPPTLALTSVCFSTFGPYFDFQGARLPFPPTLWRLEGFSFKALRLKTKIRPRRTQVFRNKAPTLAMPAPPRQQPSLGTMLRPHSRFSRGDSFKQQAFPWRLPLLSPPRLALLPTGRFLSLLTNSHFQFSSRNLSLKEWCFSTCCNPLHTPSRAHTHTLSFSMSGFYHTRHTPLWNVPWRSPHVRSVCSALDTILHKEEQPFPQRGY